MMNDFYRHYYIKSSNKQIETIDEFQQLRIGAILRKDTGDEFIKTDDNVFEKITREIQSTSEADAKYAILTKTNEFSENQILNSTPLEENHIVNKKYVDDEITRNKVDTEKFARIDVSNVFEAPQVCTSEPLSRAHLTNRAYVDDAIDSIIFDTSQLAKINISNTFSYPQFCTGTITNDLHLVTKQYVDDKVDEIIVDTTNYVRSDYANLFTQPQTFDSGIVINETPVNNTDGVNKQYVDNEITNINDSLKSFVKIDEKNTFTAEQVFDNYVSCNYEPNLENHLANKKYVDDQIFQSSLNIGNVAKVDEINTFTTEQHFNENIILEKDPIFETHAANKKYVDNKFNNVTINQASVDNYGTVKLSTSIKNATNNSTLIPTDILVKSYVDEQLSAPQNVVDLTSEQTIGGAKTFNNITTFNGTNQNAITYKINPFTFGDEIIVDDPDSPTGAIDFVDKNGISVGSMGFSYSVVDENASEFQLDNYSVFLFAAGKDYDPETGEGVVSFLNVGVTNDNVPYTKTITPPDDSNNDSIATTEWVQRNAGIILRRWS